MEIYSWKVEQTISKNTRFLPIGKFAAFMLFTAVSDETKSFEIFLKIANW